MGYTERGAGNKPLLRWAAVSRSDQTPTGPLTRPLQQLHRLAYKDEQMAGYSGILTEHNELGVT